VEEKLIKAGGITARTSRNKGINPGGKGKKVPVALNGGRRGRGLRLVDQGNVDLNYIGGSRGGVLAGTHELLYP